MVDREKGAEGNTTCPSCGKNLKLEANADGSVSAAVCAHCHGNKKKDQSEPVEPITAGQPELAGSVDRETGTMVTEEN